MVFRVAYGVLFVCTGNICRSPTAEGVLRHYAARSSLDGRLAIDSAGTQGFHVGEPPDRRAVAAAQARGIELQNLRARKFVTKDFAEFDLILAMDSGHLSALHRFAGQGEGGKRAQLSLFMDFAPGAGIADVPDPYYGGPKDFEYALDLIEQGTHGLLAYLEQQLED